MQKLAVNISSSLGPGIIVSTSSQIIYTRQTGGININMPEIEGSYLPYDFESEGLRRLGVPDIVNKLSSLFDITSKYRGRSDQIDEETATALDDILEKLTRSGPLTEIKLGNGVHYKFSSVKVDRALLHKSHEAWIFVTIKREDGIDLKGVFTWENSD